MRKFDDMLAERMKDEKFRKEYEALQPEMDIIRAIVDAQAAKTSSKKVVQKINSHRKAGIYIDPAFLFCMRFIRIRRNYVWNTQKLQANILYSSE